MKYSYYIILDIIVGVGISNGVAVPAKEVLRLCSYAMVLLAHVNESKWIHKSIFNGTAAMHGCVDEQGSLYTRNTQNALIWKKKINPIRLRIEQSLHIVFWCFYIVVNKLLSDNAS